MKKQTKITPLDIASACKWITLNPGKYARARAIKTAGRHHQACVAAGRTALVKFLRPDQ